MIISYSATMLDAGQIRDVTIEIGPTVLVRIGPPRARGEDGPHHACADFTAQRTEIAAALVEANEEAAEEARPYVCPGCYAIGAEPHAGYCQDEAIEQAREDEYDEEQEESDEDSRD